jgi:hypothetical protein
MEFHILKIILENCKCNILLEDYWEGFPKVVFTPEQMNIYNFTNWHKEVRIVKSNFMLSGVLLGQRFH